MAGADIGMLKGRLDNPGPPAVVEETLAQMDQDFILITNL